MGRTFFFTLAFLVFCGVATAQPNFFLLDKKGTTGYYAVYPKDTPLALLLVIPRPGQHPETVLRDTAFSGLATREGFVLLVPAHPEALLLSYNSFRFFQSILQDAAKRLGATEMPVAVGGLVEGGIMALQFAEECWAMSSFYPLRPQAVFAVNTPVELVAWWESSQRDLIRNSSPQAVAEASLAIGQLTHELGGSPDSLLAAYIKHSPFSRQQDDLGKAQFLLSAGLRLYYSDNLQDQIRDYDRDLYDLPIAPASLLIKRLIRQGHSNARIQLYAPSLHYPQKFPDPEACIQWLKASLGESGKKE